MQLAHGLLEFAMHLLGALQYVQLLDVTEFAVVEGVLYLIPDRHYRTEFWVVDLLRFAFDAVGPPALVRGASSTSQLLTAKEGRAECCQRR